ncbi:hybrid sensor histidine kinase/response regulator [Pyxidicoccus xibeiensis]|uniref:hybrid sensor histidine kinase/response regulator n=1 Tax=Pyxidicoccus xibeiensis TaxID=2906759 RepID=UPI0020A7AC38|nr:response regulator [Pyxidicoccus xibeiensis]MCP3140649.1 response regulator [Pyxidicoccus xibeiensis]
MTPSERLLKQFRDLVTVRLERINRSLMELETGANNAEAGRGVLRELHGLKGEARMMGFDDINALVHEMEELVRATEPHRYTLTAPSADALLHAADAVLLLSGALPSADPPPEVDKLVVALQACIRSESERLPTSLVLPPTVVAGGASSGPASAQGRGGAAVASAPQARGAGAARGAVDGGGRGGPPGSAEALARGSMDGAGSGGPQGTPGVPARGPSQMAGAGGPPGSPEVPWEVPGSSGPGRTEPVAVGSRVPPPSGASRKDWPSAPRVESEATSVATRTAPSATATAAATMGRLPAAGAPAARGTGGGTMPATRGTDARMDTAVRIGVASLDLLTSAVTNLTQVARRRELANVRRLALARELSQLAREAEDLGPAGAALAARLGTAKELAAALHRESKLLSNAELRDLGMVVEEVQTLRMLPLSVLFEPYPRMVRDLSRALGKEVELVVDGEDTRADRAVVEALREPLMHLVRNALDHGLETRVDRVSSDKNPRGCLTLRAAREGSRIILRVEDDGMGLDPAQLRKVAVRKGFLDESAANALSDAAARELIFLAGFTSREVVTDLSGRGVGLDAVRTSIQALGGDVGVESAPGWGTIFEVRVPVSLTVAPLLFIQVGEETLALSATHVSRALKVEPSGVCEVAGRPSLLVEGRVLPLAPLASLLGLAPERPVREGELVLAVKSQGGAAALVVDRVLEERVQAILPLKGVLGRFAHLTGATSLADGRLAMVLSAAWLTASAQGTAPPRLARSASSRTESRRRRILVVDDSPLTRELISNLLEAVGYDTVMAADGTEALDVLGSHPLLDLVVTDLEMPGLDGLELTRRLKGHPVHSRLPVVILTTRGGEEDRRRGLAAGADGYITKGDLVRQDLVDVVGRLLG